MDGWLLLFYYGRFLDDWILGQNNALDFRCSCYCSYSIIDRRSFISMSTERPQGAANYEADKRNMNWGSYEEDKARGLVD